MSDYVENDEVDGGGATKNIDLAKLKSFYKAQKHQIYVPGAGKAIL